MLIGRFIAAEVALLLLLWTTHDAAAAVAVSVAAGAQESLAGSGPGLWHACSVACHKRDLNESQRRQLSHDSEFQRNRQLLRIVAVAAVVATTPPVAAAAARHSTHARDTFGTLAAIKCTRTQLQSLPLSPYLSSSLHLRWGTSATVAALASL